MTVAAESPPSQSLAPPSANRQPPRRARALRARLACCWRLALFAAALAYSAPALAGPVTIEAVEIGFAGTWKVGCWTPVEVVLSGGETRQTGRLEVTVPDSDGVDVQFSTPVAAPIVIPAGETSRHRLYLKIGRVRTAARISLRDATGRQLAGPVTIPLPAAVLASQPLIVALGPSVGVPSALRTRSGAAERRTVAVELSTPAAVSLLPDRWFGYDGVDTLVISTGDLTAVEQLSAAQLDAIDQWTRLGGRLLLSVGRHGDKLLAADRPLARFAPGRFVEVVEQRQTTGLETFADARQRLDAPLDGEPFRLDLSRLADVSGAIEVYEGISSTDRPLVVRRPYGFGQVTLVTIDLDSRPLAAWSDRPRLVERLLTLTAGRSAATAAASDQPLGVNRGYDDLVGQLRGALDRFNGVTLVQFSWVAVALAIYVLLIGPGDYFLLRRVFGRLEWTWLTFPALVIACCAGVVILSPWLKGTTLHLNQLDIVDIDSASGLLRGQTWAHLYSPGNAHYNLALEPNVDRNAEAGDILLAWQGLPGAALGGMNTFARGDLLGGGYAIRESLAAAPADPAQPAARLALVNLPIEVASTKSLSARFTGRLTGELSSSLYRGTDSLLHGELRNPLPTPLTGAVIFYERWAYPLDALPAGGALDVDALPTPSNLQWLLTDRRIVDTSEVTTRWEPTSTDVPRIATMMMFHEAAGGEAYTTLLHRYQGDLDLSHQLSPRVAILIGRSERPAALLQRKTEGQDAAVLEPDADRHWTYYRILFPVATEKATAP